MNDAETHLARSQQVLWLVAVAAAMTGPLLGLALLDPNSLWVVATVAVGWLAGAAGLIVWSRLPSVETTRSRLWRAATALLFAALTLVVIGLPIAVVITYQCPEGEGVSVVQRPLNLLGLLIPAAYYGIGFWGFRRPRRLLYAWPLAIASALFVFILLELIWKASSGCSPA